MRPLRKRPSPRLEAGPLAGCLPHYDLYYQLKRIPKRPADLCVACVKEEGTAHASQGPCDVESCWRTWFTRKSCTGSTVQEICRRHDDP
jgi:hypothetical protein